MSQGEDTLKSWLNSINLSELYEPMIQCGWDDIDMLLDIDTNDKELSGLIEDITENVKLTNGKKLKLKRSIKKFQQQNNDTNNTINDDGKDEIEEQKFTNDYSNNDYQDLNHKNDNNTSKTKFDENELLLINLYSCETCGKTIKEIDLYECVRCRNNTCNNDNKQQFYCQYHLISIHKTNKRLINHKDIIINGFDDNSNLPRTLNIHKIALDLSAIKKDQKMEMKHLKDVICSHLLSKNVMVNRTVQDVIQLTDFDALVMATSAEAEYLKGGLVSMTEYKGLSDACAYGSALCLVIDIGWSWWMYHKGEITQKQLIRRSAQSVIKAHAGYVGATVGGVGGCVAGIATIGIFTPATAAIGVAGTVGLFIGALYGASVSHKAANKIFDKIWSDTEEKNKKVQVFEALQYFHFEKDDINDPKKFNYDIVGGRYKHFAKMHHPDRKTGSNEKFIQLNIYFGILQGVLKIEPNQTNIRKLVDYVYQTK